jgi:type IV pilus assembly protein PilY1
LGEREGGTSYTALDVTNPNDPQYVWRIDNANSTITGIPNPLWFNSELGQSWSESQIGKVKVGTTDTTVAFIGGGYSSDNSKGRGFLVKHYTIADSGTYSVLGNMTSCMPSTALAVDTNFDGYINRVYVGDTGSQMWRFGNQAGNEDGNVNNWTPRRLFLGNSGTKIFYSPDLVLEHGYAYLYFGTGDRMNPMYIPSPNIDRFYAVKDKNETDTAFQTRVGGVLHESNLVDVTQDLLQNPSTSQSTKNSIQSQLTSMDGWYISMENSGEKVLAPPVVIYGDVIFTTFAPNASICSSGGDARIYAVDYLTAQAVWDLDTTNTGLQKTDRSGVIGTGIPTEPVVVLGADGISRVYVAVGGKIVLLDESPSSVGFTVDSWREAF